MNRFDLDRDLFYNIEISSNTKRELYKNCLKGKRTADLRFRYAGMLTALIVAAVVGGTGIGAKAFYESVKDRMEKMPAAEVEEYFEDVNNDTSVTIDGSWSRKLTDEETLRMAELEKKYYGEALYPAGEISRVATLSEWGGKTVCYVEEDHLLHLPDELSDEQLLQFIDYNAKRDYIIEKNAEANFAEVGEGEGKYVSPYVEVGDVSNLTEEQIVEFAKKYLVQFRGSDLGPEWTTRVEAFRPSAIDPDEGVDFDMYFVHWEQAGGTPFSESYIVTLGMYDLGLKAVGVDGKEHWAKLDGYTDEEALKKVDEVRPKILEAIEKYGFTGKPSGERYEAYHDWDDEITKQLRFVWHFGDTVADVMWDISTEELAGVEIYPAELDYGDPEEWDDWSE